ncbi:hypothetical protein DPX16_12047 [Anabarilius grahami]|uniref:Uncharacterized protein n=1 Tax=Anabarilius grahami TaxID=495550 RepID=A0A3N0YZQ4_ANAGA|nr:hypothetical protein DPX16_12047 [Anabarilius grahami]
MSQHSNSRKRNEDIQSDTVRSRSSRSSGSSSSSKISMAVAMAKAKAEAAQARAAHTKKEIELKVEQARVQANLDALNDEKEKDAAIAEANALVAGLQDMGFEVCSKASNQVPQSVKDQRVTAYVSVQASLCSRDLSVRRGSDYAPPTLHSPHSQLNDASFSTPHPLSASQNQVAASADIMPHEVHEAPQTSGAPLQQSYNQVLNYSPVLQPGGSRLQQNVKVNPSPPARKHAHKTPYLLSSTTWLKGPAFLHDVSSHSPELQETYDLIDPDADSEVRPQVVASVTHITRDVIHPQRFERFSKFRTLLTAIAHLIHVARSFAHFTQDECQGWHVCRPTEEELLRAKQRL